MVLGVDVLVGDDSRYGSNGKHRLVFANLFVGYHAENYWFGAK